MRNYQTLTLIGGILTILIVLSVGLIMGVLVGVHEAFGNFTTQYGSQGTVNQYYKDRASMNNGLIFVSAAIPVAVIVSIAAITLVFVIKDKLNVLGIILIVLGVITVISVSAFGILGLALFVAAGVIALRAKPVQVNELPGSTS